MKASLSVCLVVVLSWPVCRNATAAASDWYFGLGTGVSRLTPDTDNSAFELDDDQSTAIGVLAGRNLDGRYAVEATLTRLGSATLSDDESIDYTVFSGGALGYFFGRAEELRRGEGVAGFARLGISVVNNTSDIDLEKEDNISVWAGVGVDVPISRRWAFRAELASFDGDAQAATASLVWRGSSHEDGPVVATGGEPIVSVPTTRQAAPRKSAPSTPPAELESTFVARDAQSTSLESGVVDAEPTPVPSAIEPEKYQPTPATKRTIGVIERFTGVLEGVHFEPGTATLDESGIQRLKEFADELARYPSVVVELRAHVAPQRSGIEAASGLARSRALAVARQLVDAGIPVQRLRARSFGDAKPLLPGRSSVADKANERIEIGVVGR